MTLQRDRVRAHLQLGVLVVVFLALFIVHTSSGITGLAVLPPQVERFVPSITIILGIVVVAWTLYLFFPRKELPNAPALVRQ